MKITLWSDYEDDDDNNDKESDDEVVTLVETDNEEAFDDGPVSGTYMRWIMCT